MKSTPRPCADLGEIAAGKKPGRESGGERTVSSNPGLALDDMAVAGTLYRRAREMGIGRELPLWFPGRKGRGGKGTEAA